MVKHNYEKADLEFKLRKDLVFLLAGQNAWTVSLPSVTHPVHHIPDMVTFLSSDLAAYGWHHHTIDGRYMGG